MKLPISDLRQKIADFFLTKGMNDKDAQTMTDLIVEQELVGNQFSAVGELNGKHVRLVDTDLGAKEEIAVAKPAMKLIN